MKIIIWILCSLVYSAIVVILSVLGINLGGIPTVILGMLTLLLARTLCKVWDRRSKSDVSLKDKIMAFFRQFDNAPWPLVILLVIFIIGGAFQNKMLQEEIKELNETIELLSPGYSEGYLDGYDEGYLEGKEYGYEQGHTDGMSDASGQVYDDAYFEGYVFGFTDAVYHPENISERDKEWYLLCRKVFESSDESE